MDQPVCAQSCINSVDGSDSRRELDLSGPEMKLAPRSGRFAKHRGRAPQSSINCSDRFPFGTVAKSLDKCTCFAYPCR